MATEKKEGQMRDGMSYATHFTFCFLTKSDWRQLSSKSTHNQCKRFDIKQFNIGAQEWSF